MNDDLQNIKLPLNDFVKQVAREAAHEALREHAANCEIKQVVERLNRQEITTAKILGGIAVIAAAGGTVGALIVMLFKGMLR